MSGINSAIDTALSGLEAFEAGIATVSQNLANQTTQGYATESVDISTATDTEIPGQPGSGVQTPQIVRAADGFAAAMLRGAGSAAAGATAQSAALTALSSALQGNGDIQSAINQFFQSFGTLAADPGSAAQGQTLLAQASAVVGTFQSAAASINGTISGAATSLQQGVTTANNLLAQLATINQGLARAPNDPSLLSQQEAALNSLAGLVSVNVLPQPGGQVLVAAGGTVLLDQSGAQTLTLNQSGATPVIATGTSAAPLALAAGDGTLGGNLAAAQSGAAALQALNAQAAILAANINTAQAEGLTTAGAPGGPLLSVPPPSVTASFGNAGNATLTAQIANASQLPSDGGPFTLTFGGAGWSATNQASGQTYNLGPGNNLAFAGLAVAVAATPSPGDSFILNPAPAAATDLAVTTTDPDAIAGADPYVATVGALQNNGSIVDNNAGGIAFGNDTVTAAPAAGAALIPASYYGQTLAVTFTSPTQYSVATTANPGTVIATGTLAGGGGDLAVAYPAGAASGNYWQLPFSGTPSTGDVFTLQPGGPASGSNASRIAALWTAPGGSAKGSLQQSVVGFATGLGAAAQQAQQLATSTGARVTTATANLQSISGVSLDQQAALLTNYSQAYQAAAQAISVAHTMFQSLLQAV